MNILLRLLTLIGFLFISFLTAAENNPPAVIRPIFQLSGSLLSEKTLFCNFQVKGSEYSFFLPHSSFEEVIVWSGQENTIQHFRNAVAVENEFRAISESGPLIQEEVNDLVAQQKTLKDQVSNLDSYIQVSIFRSNDNSRDRGLLYLIVSQKVKGLPNSISYSILLDNDENHHGDNFTKEMMYVSRIMHRFNLPGDIGEINRGMLACHSFTDVTPWFGNESDRQRFEKKVLSQFN